MMLRHRMAFACMAVIYSAWAEATLLRHFAGTPDRAMRPAGDFQLLRGTRRVWLLYPDRRGDPGLQLLEDRLRPPPPVGGGILRPGAGGGGAGGPNRNGRGLKEAFRWA